jgi:hypothetical protein
MQLTLRAAAYSCSSPATKPTYEALLLLSTAGMYIAWYLPPVTCVLQASAPESASRSDSSKAPLGTARLRAAARGDGADARAADAGVPEAQPPKRKQEASAADQQTGRGITVRCSSAYFMCILAVSFLAQPFNTAAPVAVAKYWTRV